VDALAHLERVPIAFLYGTPPFDDHYSRQAREVLDSSLAGLSDAARARFELELLPWGPLSTFDILPPADQDAVLDVVVPLACTPFGAGEPAPGAVALAPKR
jgi:hypothetical protein